MAITASVMTGGVNSHPTTSEEVNGWATDFVSEGIVGTYTNTSGVAPATGAFAVNAQGTPDMTVAVSAGVAYVTGTPTSQNSQTFRIKNSGSENVTISANSSGSTKYDWVYIKLDATKLNGPNVAGDDAATLVTSRSTSQSSDDGTPPTYGYPIAVITVSNGATSITNGNIRDVRTNCIVNLGSSSVSSGWTDLGYTPNTVTYNGNRSYSLVFNNTDLTSTLSPGMRLKATRLVTAPTQCADLEASSSQYFSKTSPAGTTFTDDFCFGAWVKLESYGSVMAVISRFNGTSGWTCRIDADGTVQMLGYNAGVANFSRVKSSQSVPLGRWVHIAGQLDMSAFTATSTTSYIMIDGVNVPATVDRGGTNPTALVQAGNLEVGSVNGGTGPFDGKLAQVFYSSAKITQANMRTLISQGITASLISTHSIVSAYSLSNSITDLNTTSANDLSANAGAAATNADSPFGQQADGTTAGTTEYGIVTQASFSTNTTLTVQVPEGCAIPTSGGVSAVSYSTQSSPYGFPSGKGRWVLEMTSPTDRTTSGTSLASLTDKLVLPVGSWEVFSKQTHNVTTTSQTSQGCITTLSTSGTTETNPDLTLLTQYLIADGGASKTYFVTSSVTDFVTVASQTDLTLIGRHTNTGAWTIAGATIPTVIRATFALL